ncbi:uncharacterized protein LOC119726067 [Patiria miniata]|uniref:Uncharacterized protein n=1 Tax=Patiria miniata TaxID=46514 RepID=A0A913ZPA0_PATMI|nr:uncharacterized protein LOC119726067 [Patiria miniata]
MATGYTRFENDATPHPIAGLPAGQVYAPPPPPNFGGPLGGTPTSYSQPQQFYANVAPCVVNVRSPVDTTNPYAEVAGTALGCCLPAPFGTLLSLTMSSQTSTREHGGGNDGARRTSKTIPIVVCVLVTVVISVVIVVIYMMGNK